MIPTQGFMRLLAALTLCAEVAFAQSPPPVQPVPPIGRQPQIQLQIQPGSGPVIIGPNGAITSQGGQNVAPAASAAFEPAESPAGRPVEYRVTITGSDRVLNLPLPTAPDGVTLEQGARSFSVTPLNGQLVNTSTIRFIAIAPVAGQYTIPPFTVNVGTQQVRVPAATLTVRATTAEDSVYQPARVFIDLPDRDFYIGENIQAQLLFPETPDETPQYVQHVAKTSGAVLFKPSMRTRRDEFTFDGKMQRGLVMPVEITPMLAGEVSINCEVIVHMARSGPARMQGGFTNQSTMTTPDIKIRARAVPEIGRPAGFTGAIGQFTLAQPSLSATEVEVGEPVTLAVALSGNGNLDSVPPPELPADANWTTYRPTSQVQLGENGEAATKVFTFTLIPKTEGKKGTPALPFAYFDPAKSAFVDVSVPPLPITIKPSPNAPAPEAVKAEGATPSEPPREAEPALTGLAEAAGKWSSSPRGLLRDFLYVQAIPPVLLLLVWLWRRRREHHAAHPEIMRRRRARAGARRALAEARSAARRGDHAAFLKAGVGALREAASPLDSAQAGSLTRDEVLRQLHGDEDAASAARMVFDSAEAARYASSAAQAAEVSALLPKLERAVRRLEVRA